MSLPRRAYDLLRGYVGREWDRIQGVEEADARSELDRKETLQPSTDATPVPETGPIDPKHRARRILGVSDAAPYRDIKKAFDRLNTRSRPDNFPSGSPERAKAEDIHKRVQWALRVLSEEVDVTEKRFQSLELE